VGAWGTAIFSDDAALDVKTAYNDLIKFYSDEDAERAMFDVYYKDFENKDGKSV
jgi:hypothetical protein